MAYDVQAQDLIPTLRRAVAALRDASIPFALGGSVACWARGGPAPNHDVDLIVPPSHADSALTALEAAGMRTEHPPEGWLVKAWDGDVLVDVIFSPTGLEITEDVIAAYDDVQLQAMDCKAMSLEDVLTSKLLALTEQSVDLTGLLAIVRPIREQVDWPRVRTATAESPYARAFFALVEGLGIVEPESAPAAG
jgi:hypothetical protein